MGFPETEAAAAPAFREVIWYLYLFDVPPPGEPLCLFRTDTGFECHGWGAADVLAAGYVYLYVHADFLEPGTVGRFTVRGSAGVDHYYAVGETREMAEAVGQRIRRLYRWPPP